MNPPVEMAAAYSVAPIDKDKNYDKWWLALDDPYLDSFITKALGNNFTLKQAYSRLEQANAFRRKEAAAYKPSITGELSGSARWDEDSNRTVSKGLGASLSWEIDLWKKLSSAERAAFLESGATADDVADTALLLSSQLADTYFQIIEQRRLFDVLSQQIEVSRNYLHLIKLRFSLGDASLVDIYQQRQQLASLRAQLPSITSLSATLHNRFHLLSGLSPGRAEIESGKVLPEIPALPELGVPADLLTRRPDLRARHKKLIAADYRVATAVADRLPGLRIGATAGVQGASLSSDYRFHSIFAEVMAPIVDWGRRKAEVRRRKAMVEEELSRYASAYLTAMEEVENALSREKGKKELIRHIEEQLLMAEESLRETRNRYMNGLSDYLPVMTALQTKQRLELKLISEKRSIISNRILLYRALGGSLLSDDTTLERKG
ncbi:MAG: efflux transporter outer membrane subunit [Proteobacteria bacterium]|nr:efflux transporter outer membrane subunit [Pseudomonadota bacterium]